MKTYIRNITFDVAHPKEMAEFWAAALHYDVQEAADTWAAIVDPKGVSPRVYFQQPPRPKQERTAFINALSEFCIDHLSIEEGIHGARSSPSLSASPI